MFSRKYFGGRFYGARYFPSTLAVMGGWPWARLVLFGADAGLAASLSELRVTATVPLAADEPEARQLLERRPPTVSRYLDLEKAESSPIRARLYRRGRVHGLATRRTP